MFRLINPEALEALQIRDFRLYWMGNTMSRMGTEMQRMALAWQIYMLTHQPLSLGLIGLFRAGPVIAFSIFGGALADSMSRRKLLFITQSILMSLSILLAVMTATGTATTGRLYVIVFLAAAAASADGPAHSAVIPSLVPRRLMTNAITLNNLSWSVAGIAGPAIGGLILGWWGASAVFGIDAISFLAVIAALAAVRTSLPPPVLTALEKSFKGSLKRIGEGFSFLKRTRVILELMVLDFFAVLFGASLTLLPVFAHDILKVGPQGLGVLASAPAVGSVLGAAVLTAVHRPRWPGKVVLASIAVYGLCTAIFGASPWFWLSWLMLAGTGAADTVSMTMRQSIRQLLTPDELRGRVGGVNFLFAASGTQLGELEAGVAAQLIGTSTAVALGGLACMGMAGAVAMVSSGGRGGISGFTEASYQEEQHED